MGGGEGAAGDTVIGWMGGQVLFNEEASLVKPTAYHACRVIGHGW